MRIAAVRALKNTQSASATPERRRRRLTRALLVLGLTLGTIAITAKPVDAAGVVISCYLRDTTYNWAPPGLTVKLMGMSPQGFITEVALQTKTDSNGCATFYIAPGTYRTYAVWTVMEHFDVFFYSGWSFYTYLWWPPSWYPYNYYPGIGLPGDHTWLLFGVYGCQSSWPNVPTC